MYKYDMKELTAIAQNMLIERGIELKKIADVVYELQKPYNEYVTHELCLESTERIPVSYTHLDVYKRQPFICSSSRT